MNGFSAKALNPNRLISQEKILYKISHQKRKRQIKFTPSMMKETHKQKANVILGSI